MCISHGVIQKERLLRQYDNFQATVVASVDHKLIYRSVFLVQKSETYNAGDGTTEEQEDNMPEGNQFSRTQLLLSPLQMIDEDHPVPLKGELANRCRAYVMTQETYKPLTSQNPMFFLDCKMIKVVTNHWEVARVSLVNKNCESVYINYGAPWTEGLPNAGVWCQEGDDGRCATVQQDFRKILCPYAIIVGQSLQFDLNALRIASVRHRYNCDLQHDR